MRNLLFLGIIAVLTCGCANYTDSDFKPSETSARDALTRGLTAWKEGQPGGALSPTAKGEPTLQFVDFQWTAGKRLTDFRFLQEAPTLNGSTQMFRVQLELQGEKPQAVEYYVVGMDPLWIMRDRDYRSAGME